MFLNKHIQSIYKIDSCQTISYSCLMMTIIIPVHIRRDASLRNNDVIKWCNQNNLAIIKSIHDFFVTYYETTICKCWHRNWVDYVSLERTQFKVQSSNKWIGVISSCNCDRRLETHFELKIIIPFQLSSFPIMKINKSAKLKINRKKYVSWLLHLRVYWFIWTYSICDGFIWQWERDNFRVCM